MMLPPRSTQGNGATRPVQTIRRSVLAFLASLGLAATAGALDITDGTIQLTFSGTLDPVPYLITGSGPIPLTTQATPIKETLQLNGTSLGPFTLTGWQKAAVTDPAFGVGTRWTLSGTTSGPGSRVITETLTVGLYDAYPGAALLLRSYLPDSGPPLAVDTIVAGSLSVGDGTTPLRLSIGPAADVLYKDEEYLSIPVKAGYAKSGDMLDGGTPLVCAWDSAKGIAFGHVEPRNEAVELPTQALADNKVQISLVKGPVPEFLEQTTIDSANGIDTVRFVVIAHTGDYFAPFSTLSRIVSDQLPAPIVRQQTEASAYEPYWKTWGLSTQGDWTKADIWNAANELSAVGISWILLDWGWFEQEGDWVPNSDRFTSEQDMIQFIAALKQAGFRVGLWWAPLQVEPVGVDPSLPPHCVKEQQGTLFLDDDNMYNLSPSDPWVQNFVRQTARKLIATYGADHLYLDSQEVQLSAQPDFDPTHTGTIGAPGVVLGLADHLRHRRTGGEGLR